MVCAASGRVFLIDDGEYEAEAYRVRRQAPVLLEDDDYVRDRRDTPVPYGAPAPAYHEPAPVYGKGPRGRVGPVYTFVKTDPQANFKWGVRHRAGAQYGR